METIGTFIVAALALTGSPGPNTLSLAAVGAAYGRVRGFRYMLGLNLGVFIVIAIVGLSTYFKLQEERNRQAAVVSKEYSIGLITYRIMNGRVFLLV